MNIQALGDEKIDFLVKEGFINEIEDLYFFDYNKLLSFKGFGEKTVNNIINGIEESKKVSFVTLLTSLGLPDLGRQTVLLLVENGYNTLKKIIDVINQNNAEVFEKIPGIGPKTAISIENSFKDVRVLNTLNKLEQAGFCMAQEVINHNNGFLTGTIWVITGSFDNFKPRDKAAELIEMHGGKVTSAISSSTSYLLAGEKAGSKRDKAEKLGIQIIDEETFLKMIENSDKKELPDTTENKADIDPEDNFKGTLF